ncbi:hypothetical protein BDW69DRAFT_163778 [Aspergillus filifer]
MAYIVSDRIRQEQIHEIPPPRNIAAPTKCRSVSRRKNSLITQSEYKTCPKLNSTQKALKR